MTLNESGEQYAKETGKDKASFIAGALSDVAREHHKVSGGVWVNAGDCIDRLPLEQFLHILDDVNCKRLGNFFDDNGEIKLGICGTEMYASYIVPQNGLHHYFLLAGSLTPLAVDNIKNKESDKVTICEGNCIETHGEHTGLVKEVQVFGFGTNLVTFNYCENAIEEDIRRGFTVEYTLKTQNLVDNISKESAEEDMPDKIYHLSESQSYVDSKDNAGEFAEWLSDNQFTRDNGVWTSTNIDYSGFTYLIRELYIEFKYKLTLSD